MASKPRQFEWWRRRAAAAAPVSPGRFISPERARALGYAVLIGAIAWTAFYWTMGSHRIERLDEYARYLKGEDLYGKYKVARLSWDCEGLRRQFAVTYISERPDRMALDDRTLVFRRGGLDPEDFAAWVARATQRLSFGKARRAATDAALLPAMMVRLFHDFRFESGDRSRTVRNDFDNKCRQ